MICYHARTLKNFHKRGAGKFPLNDVSSLMMTLSCSSMSAAGSSEGVLLNITDTTVSRSIVSVFFVGKYPTECGKYPRFVLMVAVVEFDGRMTYRRKDHRLALLLVPYFCL